MNESIAEFVVVGDVEGTELFDEPYRTVIGRCGNVPIQVGDHFEALVRFRESKTIADYEGDPPESSRDDVSLTVRAIRAYQRDRKVLDRGMTGSLVLTGEGLNKLGGGCALLGSSTVEPGNGTNPRQEEEARAKQQAAES